MSVYQIYEAEKRRLINLNLPPEQYQKAIKRLAKELGI